MTRILTSVVLTLVFAATSVALGADAKKEAPEVLKFKMKTLAGKEADLSQYQGKVLLIVNVASKCGYTPQYEGLQALHDKFGKEGLVVLGVPCNQFGGQEPGTELEIAEFCKATYGVSFAMLSKVDVKGDSACELYKFLTSKETNASSPGPVKWNFEKFLIGRDGKIAGRFASGDGPSEEKLTKAIQAELAKK